MVNQKSSFGIRLKKELVDNIDRIVKESEYLKPTRSEVIEAILTAFFNSKVQHLEKARELIIIKRKKQ